MELDKIVGTVKTSRETERVRWTEGGTKTLTLVMKNSHFKVILSYHFHYYYTIGRLQIKLIYENVGRLLLHKNGRGILYSCLFVLNSVFLQNESSFSSPHLPFLCCSEIAMMFGKYSRVIVRYLCGFEFKLIQQPRLESLVNPTI